MLIVHRRRYYRVEYVTHTAYHHQTNPKKHHSSTPREATRNGTTLGPISKPRQRLGEDIANTLRTASTVECVPDINVQTSEVRVWPQTAERKRLKATCRPNLDARNEATSILLPTLAVQKEHHLPGETGTHVMEWWLPTSWPLSIS